MNIIDISLRVLKEDISRFGELSYINKFGSFLYGLSDYRSDIDILGIYFPYPDKVIKGEIKKNFSFSSKEENEKAKPWDYEIYIYNFFDFICKLNQGDIKTLNLFFSYTNKFSIIHIEKRYLQVLNYLLSIKPLYINRNLISYINYIIEELKKFKIRGSFEGSLSFLLRFFEKYKNKKLGEILDKLKSQIKPYEQEKIKFLNDKMFFFGKYFLYSFKVEYILSILKKWEEEIKQKKQKKEENLQKRLYHAKRAIYEINMLLNFEKIKYPFKGVKREKLYFLKKGERINFKKEINNILNQAQSIKEKIEKLPLPLKEEELLKICDNSYRIYFKFPLLSYTKHFLNLKGG